MSDDTVVVVVETASPVAAVVGPGIPGSTVSYPNSSGTATVAQRPMVYDPRDYGAKYDNTQDDSTAIQAAIDACEAAGGGIVDLYGSEQIQSPTAGSRIKINTTIRVKSSVWFRGRGPQTSLTGTANPMIAFPTSGTVIDRITITDLLIQSAAGIGVLLDSTGLTGATQIGWPRITLSNITIVDAVGDAFKVILSGIFETRFLNCVSARAGGHGFNLSMTDSEFVMCSAGAGSGHGFSVAGANNKFSACKAYGNTLDGFLLAGSGRHCLSACEAQDNLLSGYHIASSSVNTSIAGCLSDTNNIAGFNIDGAFKCTIAGCSAIWGGGGSGQVTKCGFLFSTNSGSGVPSQNVVSGISNCPAPVGGYVVGNTVTVNNGPDAVQYPAFASTFTPDPFAGGTIEQTLTGNTTINPPVLSGFVGQKMRFIWTQDATGGRTVTFTAAYRTNWTPTTTAGVTNIIDFVFDGRYWRQVSYTPGLSSVAAITDSFTRSNGALGTADTGQTWSVITGNVQIVSDTAGGGGSGFAEFGNNVAVLPCATADATISATIAHNSSGAGIAFRCVDSNNYWSLQGSTLKKKVAGTITTLIAGGQFNLSDGDTVTVILSGPSITVLHNGTVVYAVADAALVSATQHGVFINETADSVDNLSIV